MKIAVLGCGPAGMFAAHAAAQRGHDVRIFSKPRKSFMRGAQYLHEPIPELSKDSFEVDYQLRGTTDGYRIKVYGEDSTVEVSPETLVGVHPAWDIREAYDSAWKKYSDLILPWNAQNDWIPETFDEVVSTIPADLLCNDMSHKFEFETVLSTSSAPRSLGGRDNIVMCSGGDDFWYRSARIHGWETTEYPVSIVERFPMAAVFGGQNVHEVVKPIKTDCNCHPEVIRSGRYGKWTKGVLSHESYLDVERILR